MGAQQSKEYGVGTGKQYTLMRHRVQPGETLWGIAKRTGHSVNVLAVYNEIPNPAFIRIGQDLVLPYKVQEGDSLTKIAHGFRTKVSFIQSDNDLPNANRILAGQSLMIFDHKKKSDSSRPRSMFRNPFKKIGSDSNESNPSQ